MKIFQKKQLSQRGAIFVLFALMLPVMCGFLGLAVDLGLLYVSHARLQDEADAAALAGAMHLEDGATRGDSIRDAIAANLSANDSASSIAVAYSLVKNIKADTDQKNGITTVACEANDRTVNGGSAGGTMTASWGIFKKENGTERVRVTLEKTVPTFFINVITDAFKDGFEIKVAAAAEGPVQAVASADDGGFSIITDRGNGNFNLGWGGNSPIIYNGTGHIDASGNLIIDEESTYSRGIASLGLNGPTQPVKGLIFIPNAGSVGPWGTLSPQGTLYDSQDISWVGGGSDSGGGFVNHNKVSFEAADTKLITDWKNIEADSNGFFASVSNYYTDLKDKAASLDAKVAADVAKSTDIYNNAMKTNAAGTGSFKYTIDHGGWQENIEVRYYVPQGSTSNSLDLYVSMGQQSQYYNGAGSHLTDSMLKDILTRAGYSSDIKSINKLCLVNEQWYDSSGKLQNGANGYSLETNGIKFGDVYLLPNGYSNNDFNIYGNNNIFSGTVFSDGNLWISNDRSVFGRLSASNLTLANNGKSKYYFMPVGDGDPSPSTPPKPLRLVE